MVKGSNKRLIIVVVVMLPLFLIVGGYLYFMAVGDSELQNAVAEADWLEPEGWRLAELEARRATLPDAENSALQVMAVKQLLPSPWPNWPVPAATKDEEYLRQARQDLENSLGDLAPPVQLNEAQITALRAELKRAAPALDKARKLAVMPNGRYAIAWSRGYISTLLPQIQDARAICSLLAYDALLKAQDGDLDGALSSCRAALNVARSVGDMPMLIAQLVRIACRTVAMRKVERTLAQGQPSEKAMVTTQGVLEQEAEEPLLLFGTRGERAGLDELMDAIQAGDVKLREIEGLAGMASPSDRGNPAKDRLELLLMAGSAKRQRAAILRYMTQAVEIAKLPPEEQHEKFKAWEAAAKDQPLMVRLLCPAVAKVAKACHRTQAELRCAAVAVAVERYRQANRRWPESLSALVPKYLKKIPTDPFDGKPLRFAKFDQGVVVYSVGIDRVDNGGHIDRQHPEAEGADLGFRLWDVAQRRQPPEPFKLPERPAELPDPLDEEMGPEMEELPFPKEDKSGGLQLRKAIAEADRLEPDGWRMTNLEAKRASIPDPQNSSLVVLGAKGLMPPNWPHWPLPPGVDEHQGSAYAQEVRLALDMSFSGLPPPVLLNAEQKAAVRTELKRAGSALTKARALADMPMGRYRFTWSRCFLEARVPHASASREIANLLRYDARLRAQDADLDGALASCRATINVARSFGDEPSLISLLVRISCRTMGMRGMRVPWPRDRLRKLPW